MILAIRVVTVVFPFEPVTATTVAGQRLKANSISLITGILEFISQYHGQGLAGHPGEITIRSLPLIKSGCAGPIPPLYLLTLAYGNFLS